MSVRRIAVLGAESSGKSTLCGALARRYDTLWVPEYLREFVDTHDRVPFEEDQYGIARTQRAREDAAAAAANAFLFCDTTPLMTALYSRVYWGRVNAELALLAATHDYALTLVTAPDTPWVADGLMRESEAVRQQVFAMLVAELDARGIRFVLLEGDLPHRLRQVEAALKVLVPL
ncbi:MULTISPECIES: AAA family ATPase [unclassified Massilia]|uniref:AAA family ATPase n=1 Tax=unclassified Massilia TaxID=2609279 RepID=UPI00178080D1|nr:MULTISPECIES: ATP-binding protein [unclassified Massilia]MBD8532443.1 ATP-binding protein [Massilia sp. CFBP 13647]MBD8675813.1 ATP-binding protein [Massilia sp. CFBP 13721]